MPPPAEASRLAGSTQQIQVAPPNPDGSTRRTRAEPPPAPEPARRRGGLRRTRVRRTHRTVRHVDPWSVFKVSILLYACLYVAVMLAGVLLWAAAYRSGLVDNLESFIAEVGSYAVWEIDGQVIFERARIIGLVMASAGVAFSVLMAIIFNLVSDLVGGIRLTILEEEPPEDG
ncbi:MAG TPA: hypothetical protein DEP69_02370 [Acidimicrobiaceae bacterium]|nr:hypothetical protein [Acidimicrobiaceae bacterium]